MNFTIKADSFAKILQRMQHIVEHKTRMHILSNVLIETVGDDRIRVSATDLDISMSCEGECRVEGQGSITLAARTLYELVRSLGTQDVIPEVVIDVGDDGRVKLSSGTVNCRLMSMPADEFPSIPVIDEKLMTEVKAEVLAEMVEKTDYAISTDQTRYNLNGIFVHSQEDGRLRLVAVDGRRMAMIDREVGVLDVEAFKSGVIIPRKGVMGMKKLFGDSDEAALGGGRIGIAENSIFVVRGRSHLAIRLIDGKFPDYTQVIPRGNDKVVRISCERFLQALRRVMIFSPERGHGVKLSIQEGQMSISSEEPAAGNAVEGIEVGYKGDGIDVGFNGCYLMDVLAAASDAEVTMELSDALGPVLIRPVGDPDYTCVVMPMRV